MSGNLGQLRTKWLGLLREIADPLEKTGGEAYIGKREDTCFEGSFKGEAGKERE